MRRSTAGSVQRAQPEREITLAGAIGRPVENRYHADPTTCVAWPLRLRCLQHGTDHRVLVVHRGRAGAMRLKLRQPRARRPNACQKVIIESIFGQLKEDRDFTTFSLRGLVLAKAEHLLGCLAHNLGQLTPDVRAASLSAGHRLIGALCRF